MIGNRQVEELVNEHYSLIVMAFDPSDRGPRNSDLQPTSCCELVHTNPVQKSPVRSVRLSKTQKTLLHHREWKMEGGREEESDIRGIEETLIVISIRVSIRINRGP